MGGGTGEAGEAAWIFGKRALFPVLFRSCFVLVFALVFAAFLFVFGSFWEVILGGFWDQVRFKTALETILFEKSECSRKALKTNEKTRFPSPRGDPKRPKIAPRWHQDGLFWVLFSLRFLHRFWVAF